MYERHFGITGPPFQLSPDPDFYFDSPQHRAALAALRQAFALDTPFVALSGEVGAGKTTVLRAWIAEVHAYGVAVAQLTNTQLDADDLLRAVATAFGISTADGTSAQALAGLRGFLRGLAGRRALLLIDEAQNLDRPALQCLVSLTDMAAAEKAPLRICLAGQPELGQHLADPTLPELRARLQPPSHLSPLDAAATRHYIEHRLRKVGWAGKPSFDDAAFGEIHAVTGGVPRRINVLCSRLMLAQFLSDTSHVDRRAVVSAAHALHAEIGEGTVTPEPPPAAPLAPRGPALPNGALWLVASGRSDHVKAVPLLYAIHSRRDLPAPVVVSLSDGSPWRLDGDLHAFFGVAQRPVALFADVSPTLEQTELRFGRLLDQCRPAAIVLFDGDALSHWCAMAARRRGVRVAQVGADAQGSEELADAQSARAAIGREAGVRMACNNDGPHASPSSNEPRVAVGNLLIDATHFALQMADQSTRQASQRPLLRAHLGGPRGYGVVALKQLRAEAASPCQPELMPVLRAVSRDLPLVWPMRQATLLAMRNSGLARTFDGERIACIPELGHVSFVRLLRDATCVLTDGLDVMEEAAELGVPCLSLGQRHVNHVEAGGWLPATQVGHSATKATRAVWASMFNGGTRNPLPALWDGDAATRAAAHLAQWLGAATPNDTRPLPARHAPPPIKGAGADHAT